MKNPRQHHVVPEFHLNRFTNGDFLTVYDTVSKKFWLSKAENAATQRDFYRLEASSEIQDEFEIERKFLPEVEGKAKIIIDKIIQNKTLPDDITELTDFFIFVGISYSRIPFIRRHFEKFLSDVGKAEIELKIQSDPESLQKYYDQQDIPPEDRFSVPELIDFMKKGKISMNNGYLAGTTLQEGVKLAPLLLQRNWVVATASEGSLISSDNPVIIRHATPLPIPFPPGFAMTNTQVMLTLSSSTCLIGCFEGLPSGPIALSAKQIAQINSDTILMADRCIYSSTKDFTWIDREMIIRTGTELPNFNRELHKITK